MAAQMRTEKGRLPAPSSAAVRKDNQRVRSRLRCGSANSHLAPWGVFGRICERVLHRRVEVLARVLRGCRIPDITRKPAIALRIPYLEGAHAHGALTAGKGIVLVPGRGWRMRLGYLFTRHHGPPFAR